MSALGALLVNGILLGVLAKVAARAGRQSVLRLVVLFQCGYWLLAFAGRGLVLLVSRPTPRANDSIADGRLVVAGDYEAMLAEVLWITNAGILSFVIVLVACMRRWSVTSQSAPAFPASTLIAAVTLLIGWACRLGPMAGLPTNSVVSSLALFAPLGVGLLLLSSNGELARSDYALRVTVLLASEVLYGILIESKTPMMAVALFSVLGLAKRGWRLGRAWWAALAVGTLTLFVALQNVKLSQGTQGDLASVDATYPLLVRPLLPVLRRFDLLSAVTDAVSFGSTRWLSIGEYSLRLVHGIAPWATPAEWGPPVSAGLAWAAEVRSVSLPAANRNVSLAEGFVGEGYAAFGLLGVISFGAIFAVMTVVVARLVDDRHVILQSVGLLMLAQPVLFERGLLGATEIFGQAVQAWLAFILLWLLLGSRGRNPSVTCGASTGGFVHFGGSRGSARRLRAAHPRAGSG